MPNTKVLIKKNESGYYFEVFAPNGRLLLQSKNQNGIEYTRKENAKKGAKALIEAMAGIVDIEDLTGEGRVITNPNFFANATK